MQVLIEVYVVTNLGFSVFKKKKKKSISYKAYFYFCFLLQLSSKWICIVIGL